MNSVTITTLNMGLLQLKIGKFSIFEFSPYVEDRFDNASKALDKIESDIVILQEIYGANNRVKLQKTLSKKFPFSAYTAHEPLLGLGNGFLTLSKLPIICSELHEFHDLFIDERLFSDMGYQVIDIEMPVIGPTRIINAHLTAGGVLRSPENFLVEEYRSLQIEELLRIAKQHVGIHILTGDFNCSPSVSSKNYESLINAGYIDCYSSATDIEDFTWEISNPLNKNGPHKTSPSQRIDHIFLPRDALNSISPAYSQIILKNPFIKTRDGNLVTLSDHYALQVKFDLTGK